MFRLRIVLLLCLVTGTLTQDLSLLDAFDDNEPVTPKPKEQPKVPEKPKNDGDFGFSLEDALGPDLKPKPKPTEKPPKSGGGDFGFSLEDALGPDLKPKPKPTEKPPKSGGGGGVDPAHDPHGGADQPQAAGSGQIAGIASAIGMALLGAGSSYFAYQKKKLCFKLQGGTDPERGKVHHGNQSDGTQIFSNLLRTS